MSMYDDGTYLAQHPTWDEEHSAWKASQVAEMIERNSIRFASYADIGCGAGRVVHELSLRYPSAVFHGYDVSPQAINLAKRFENTNVKFFNRDILSEAETRYDVASAIDVFEHVEDYIGWLRRVKLVATFLIFHIPLDISVQAILRNLPMNNRKIAGHLHYFMKETALATVEDAGYEVLDSFYTPGGIALASSWRAKAARIPRMLFFKISPDACAKILGGFSLMVLASEKSGSNYACRDGETPASEREER